MALTPILGIQQVATNQSNKEATINDAVLALEAAGNAALALDFSTAPTGTYVVSETAFSRNFMLKAVNAPSDRPSITISLPHTLNGHAIQRLFVARNATTSALTLSIANAAAGSTGAIGVPIPQGSSRLIAMDGDELIIASEATTVTRFIDIADAPHSYAGNKGMTFRVNATEDGLEFAEGLSIHDLADVDETANTDGAVLRFNGDSEKWVASALTLVTTFLGLSDTPDAFTGKASYVLRINAAENAIEFVNPVALGGPVTGGGNTGQVLTKQSATDGDYAWSDPHGLPNGGQAGQWLRKVSNTEGDAGWSDLPSDEIPAGGVIGQVLAKTGSADGAVGWQDAKSLVEGYTTAVVNAVAISLISGDTITLPWTPALGNALVVAYFSSAPITPSPGWSVLAALGASGSAWGGAATLARLVQSGDTAAISPVPPAAADAAIVYEIDARYIRGGITSLVANMAYSDTGLPEITETVPSILLVGVAQRIGFHPAITVTGSPFKTVVSQDSGAGGNRYAAGIYIDPTDKNIAVDVAYTLSGGTDGAFFYISVPAIEEEFEEAPVDFTAYLRRNKAWAPVPPHAISLIVSDETTNLTAGTSKITYRLPYNFTLKKVKASLSHASTSGAVGVNVKANGASIFTTPITIDVNKKTSAGATTPAVLGATTSYADDTEITVDISAAGSGAAGLKVYLIGTPS